MELEALVTKVLLLFSIKESINKNEIFKTF